MHRFARLTLCACAGILAAQSAIGAAQDPFVEIELDAAFARAEAQDKLLLVFYHSEAVNQSKLMLETTMQDPVVKEWIAENFIAIKLDRKKHRSAFGRFRVTETPTIQLLKGNKRLVESMPFFQTTEQLMTTAKAALSQRTVNSKPEGTYAFDPYSWLAWGNYLFNNEGNPDEMVEAYVWCLRNADKYEPGFRNRNLEFLLKRIAYAKQISSNANLRLTEERQRLIGLLHGGAGTDLLASELVRVNFWMRSEELTRKAFVDLKNKDAATESMRRVLMYHELAALNAHEQYKEVLEHLPDPVREIRSRLDRTKAAEKLAASQETAVDLGVVVLGLPESRAQWVSDASLFYECLLAVGRGKDAADLLDLVLGEVPTGRAYALFMDKSIRLKLAELTRKTAKRGLKVVNSQGVRRINTALARLENSLAQDADPEAKEASEAQDDGASNDDGR